MKLRPDAVVALHAPLACLDDATLGPLAVWLAEKSGLPLVSDHVPVLVDLLLGEGPWF
jgi:hypothetical protein